MTPHDLLANFEVLAKAPSGIQHLRELVLELAVRGKLVDQSPREEPVGDLLRRIKVDQANLIRAKKIRAGRPLLQICEDELPFHIPPSWAWIRLGDIGDWGAGATPTRGNSKFFGGPTNWFKSGELNDGRLVGPSVETITPLALSNFSLRENRPGDVLIALYGATIGKLAILDSPGTTNQAVCACTCFADAYNHYLFLFLMAWRRRFTAQGTGGAQPNISKEKVVSTIFPLPPLPEQRRIVTRADELMALLDRLEVKHKERETVCAASRESALSALRDAPTLEDVETAWLVIQERFHDLFTKPEDVEPLRQTILFLSGEGRLVPQDHRGGTAFDLLKEILFAKATGAKGGRSKIRKEDAYPNAEETRPPLPVGWTWVSIEQCCEVMGGIQKTASRRPKENAFPYLRVANVQRGRFDLTEIAKFELEPGELERWRLEPSDLLIVEGNGSEGEIGRCAMWTGQIQNCVHQNHIIRCRAFLPKIAPYILHYLNSPQGVATMKSLAVTTSGLYNLSVGKIRSIWFPLPPEGEQSHILQRVEKLMQGMEELREVLTAEESLSNAFAAAAVHHLDV